jgi:hypothetical protein
VPETAFHGDCYPETHRLGAGNAGRAIVRSGNRCRVGAGAALKGVQELGVCEWLRQICIRTGGRGGVPCPRRIVGRDEYHGDGRHERASVPSHREAISSWQPQIRDDEIRTGLVQELDGFRPGPRGHADEPQWPEQPLAVGQDLWLNIRDEDDESHVVL